jgi:hypothetical protein
MASTEERLLSSWTFPAAAGTRPAARPRGSSLEYRLRDERSLALLDHLDVDLSSFLDHV